jgi:hypothetical protein
MGDGGFERVSFEELFEDVRNESFEDVCEDVCEEGSCEDVFCEGVIVFGLQQQYCSIIPITYPHLIYILSPPFFLLFVIVYESFLCWRCFLWRFVYPQLSLLALQYRTYCNSCDGLILERHQNLQW